ncbi:unnamed protein product [Rotaria sp. Silwood2]|nr:unnamed protein product [Rotaria sp. Silwood2]CAF4486286.1 unnamed protein product [Rotaria sp. Silwood2]
MAQAMDSMTKTSAPLAAAPIVRDLSPLFVQLLNDTNPSLIRKSLECLRNFSQSLMDDESNIIRSFRYLKDKVQQGGDTDDDASLISLIVVTLIIPCYRFYSTHDIFALHFFQLFDLLLSHPSVSKHENHRFSIAVIISRTNLYPPKSVITTIDKWTTKMWLGKLIGQNPTTNKMRYQSEKPFPFAPDSQICNILCDNTKYPIDITNQFDLFIEKARQHQHTNADELITLQNILNQLFRCQFILQTFLNADQCLSLMLSFAVQRQRIIDVQITDKNNLQAQTQLESIKNQMINQFDYLPNVNNRDFKFIQSECKIKWTDGKEFIYSSNTIHSRPSFLSPLSKLLQYAYVQQQDDSDTDAKGLWNLLLHTIHQIFTKHLETSESNYELAQTDMKDFFLYFLNHDDEQIRQTGIKFVTIFVKDLSISTDTDLPPLISCVIIKNLFQSMINNENFLINEILLNGCLESSLNWSIDDLCLLLTSLAMKLSEISSSNIDSLGHHQVWFQFFVDIININLIRLTTLILKTNHNFIEFSRQIQTSLFTRLFQLKSEHTFEILKFIRIKSSIFLNLNYIDRYQNEYKNVHVYLILTGFSR